MSSHPVKPHYGVTEQGFQPLPNTKEPEGSIPLIRRLGDDVLGNIFHWAVYVEEPIMDLPVSRIKLKIWVMCADSGASLVIANYPHWGTEQSS